MPKNDNNMDLVIKPFFSYVCSYVVEASRLGKDHVMGYAMRKKLLHRQKPICVSTKYLAVPQKV